MTNYYKCFVEAYNPEDNLFYMIKFKDFLTFNQAKAYGYKEIKKNYTRLDTDDQINVNIFKIPFNHEFTYYNDDNFKDIYDLIKIYSESGCFIEHICLNKSLIKIQRKWKEIYNKRIKSINLIKKHYKVAIANPYTQLCKNRLLREFNEMK